VPAIAALGIPPFYYPSKWTYPWDAATVALVTACLLFLAEERRRALTLAFAVACVNKETAILIPLTIATLGFCEGPARRPSRYRTAAALLALYVAIRVPIALLLRGNAGPVMEFHFFDHNVHMFAQVARDGYGVVPIVVAAALIAALAQRWSAKPLLLRASLIMVAPLLFLGTFFGWFEEWRQYLECYPALLVLGLPSYGRVFGVEPRARAA
jgi:hypothetical protein